MRVAIRSARSQTRTKRCWTSRDWHQGAVGGGSPRRACRHSPQTRWSQLGEALQVPRPARDITKPWRERRRSHPGRVRRPLEAAPRTGAFDLVREYALPIPLTVIVRDSQTMAVNDAKSAARRQATRVASAAFGGSRPERGVVSAWSSGGRSMRSRTPTATGDAKQTTTPAGPPSCSRGGGTWLLRA